MAGRGSTPAPDARLRGQLVVLAAAAFAYLTAEVFPVGALPEISAGLDVSEARVGLLVTLYAVAAGVVALPVARATRLVPLRGLLVASLALLAAGQVAGALAPTYDLVLASRVLPALGHGVLWAAAPVAAARLAPPGTEGRATAAVFLGGSLGIVAGSPLSAGLAQVAGWRPACLAVGVLAAVTAVAARLLLPPLTVEPEAPGRREPLPIGPLALVCVVTAVVAAAHFVTYTYLATLAGARGVTGAGLVALLVAYGAVGVVAVRATGRVVDRRPAITAVALFAVMTAGLLLAAPRGALLLWLVAVLAWAGAYAAAPIVLQGAVIRLTGATGPAAVTASVFYVVAFQVGISSGAWIGGLLVDGAGVAWLPLVSGLAVALVVPVVVVRRQVFGSWTRL